MKNKFRYVVVFLLFLTIGIITINIFDSNNEQQVKGTLEVIADNNTYDYLVECADNFMKENLKTTVIVKKIENYDQITSYTDNKNLNNKIATIIQINRYDFDNLKVNKEDYYNKDNKLLDEYVKNFSSYRIKQIKYGENFIGIPLTSRPLGFFVRNDMLESYGYKRESLNTWDDVINIGKDIYEKSNGKISIINATGQDYEDLVDLLIMESISEKGKTDDSIKEEVEKILQNLKDNNILNTNPNGEFLGRIASINAMNEISDLDVNCSWSVKNPPSIKPGTNKFFASEGDNLLVLNENDDNKKLVEKFMTYVMTNTEEALKYVKKGAFFSSYLYSYNNKEIEEPVKNFTGKSPIVVLSNIEEKSPGFDDYDKYIKIKSELKNN